MAVRRDERRSARNLGGTAGGLDAESATAMLESSDSERSGSTAEALVGRCKAEPADRLKCDHAS